MKIFKSAFVLSVLLTMLVACGDDSSSSSVSPEPAGDSSSSVIPASSGDESSSSQKNSNKDKSSSSVEKNSSSSVGGKNSSSSVVKSSSSFKLEPVCEDGETTIDEAFGEYIYETCRGGFWEADSTKSKRVLDSLAAIEKNKEHPNMDSLFAGYKGEYFEFEDPRDNRKYKYVEFNWIPEDGKGQETFYVMAENLNYGKMIPSGTTKFDDKVTEKLCYVDDEWFCDNHFGGLYSWAEAMNLPKVCDSVAVDSNEACKSFADAVKSVSDPRVVRWQGICPDGWHIMTQYEWQHTADNSSYLRSKILWEENSGLNGSGMSIIPTGNGRVGIHEYTYIWLPAAEDVSAKSISILSVASEQHTVTWSKVAFQSIRCVMDANNTLIH
ncbi:MAG: hypothetical protein IKM81_01310 [Fibrobacter sp.]|nr:hypothetical protein [Fibrobacter sp.]